MAKGDSKIIERYEKDFEAMQTYWSDLHKAYEDDTKFLWFNDQWDSVDKTQRNSQSTTGDPLPPRPTEVFNILKPFIIKVVNGIKKMKPSLRVIPVDSQTDKDLAEVRRGIIKSIEKNAGALPARLHAIKDTVSSGFGFYRFITEFTDPKSVHQEFRYKTILDATQVLYDDDSKEPDGSDCKKVIVFETYGKEQFKVEFGKDWEDIYQMGETARAWGGSEKPIVSEYWYIEEKPETLYTVQGKGYYESELEPMAEEAGVTVEELIDYDNDGEPITRKTHSRKVWCCKMAGKKVLEKTLWPGYWIPIFKIEGRKTVSQGKTRIDGLTRDARGSQKAYNYARNNQIERMALSPKVPYFYPMGGIPATERKKYGTLNTRNWSGVGYNAYDELGRPLPPPNRIGTVQVDPGLANEAMTAAEEIKAELGMFASYMGDTSSERSGRAILAGASESQDIVYDFSYNMALTMQFENRVLNEVIPKVIDTPRQVRMVGEDDTEKVVMVNQQAINEKGEDYYYDLNQGKYDIYMEIGPSDESKRFESREGMKSFTQLVGPQFGPLLADLMAKESDFRMADEIAARAKKFIQKTYPGIIEEDQEPGKPNPEVEAMQQQMQMLQQQLQEVGQAYQQLQQDKQIEAQKVQQADMVAEERNEIDIFNAETTRFKAESDAKLTTAKMRMEAQQKEREYQLEMMKLESDRQKTLQDQDTKLQMNQVNQYFDALKAELTAKMQALTPQPLPAPEPPVFNFNVTNQIPGGGKKIIKQTGNGYEVTTEDEDMEE